MGGAEHEKQLIPLLISFCKTDERKVAQKASQIIEKIIKNSKDLALETIKKLMKADMNVTRECSLQLISNLFPVLESCESTLLELYTPLFNSENPQTRIIAAKFLSVLFLLFRTYFAISRQKRNYQKFLKKFIVKEEN